MTYRPFCAGCREGIVASGTPDIPMPLVSTSKELLEKSKDRVREFQENAGIKIILAKFKRVD